MYIKVNIAKLIIYSNIANDIMSLKMLKALYLLPSLVACTDACYNCAFVIKMLVEFNLSFS